MAQLKTITERCGDLMAVHSYMSVQNVLTLDRSDLSLYLNISVSLNINPLLCHYHFIIHSIHPNKCQLSSDIPK